MQDTDISIPRRKPRTFVAENYVLTGWESLKPYLENLKNRPIRNAGELEQWLMDRSELEAVLAEEIRWRYIRMTTDTQNKEYEAAYQDFVSNIEPKAKPYLHALDRKLVESLYTGQLGNNYRIYLRDVKNRIDLYREENLPLIARVKVLSNKYAQITGQMTLEYNGEVMTMQQASLLLKSPDARVREEIFHLISHRRLQDREALDNLFDELLRLRHQIATQAGFDNYRDFKFRDLGRFDYTPEDCLEFHEAIAREFVPLVEQISRYRKKSLQLERYRPWDTAVDVTGKPPLKPFSDTRVLIDKTIDCFQRLDPFFAGCLRILREMGHLDLESRIGKAPGGYNSTLPEIGVPFIFMNASGSSRDVRTLLHECGHAVHAFLTRDIPFVPNRSTPSEVAELASMSMEMLTMDYWDTFYKNQDDLLRASIEQIEGVINVFPWIARIDSFQHWIYTHPDHTSDDRKNYWMQLNQRFGDPVVDWEGLEGYLAFSWQRQLHLFEVPFYYIEYGIAQLGAIAIWKRYKENPRAALEAYKKALALGYTKSISEIYQTAGIPFDFSQSYIHKLASFLREELEELYLTAGLS